MITTIQPSPGKELLTKESHELLGTLLDRTVTSVGSGITQQDMRGPVAITIRFDDDTELEFYVDTDGLATGPVRIENFTTASTVSG